MDIASRLFEAHTAAQFRFREMLIAGCYSDANDPRTIAYIVAERLVDSILVDAQGKAAQDGLDAALADGDHFVFPAGVGR